jgi:hypothetical protein
MLNAKSFLYIHSQLQMQALSRNTASVAQDFHNAGGVFNKKSNFVVNNSYNNNNNSVINNNIFNSSTSASIGNSMNNTKGELNKAMSDSPIESPPAATFERSFDFKRRRKSMLNDKENENELLRKQIEFLKNQHELFLNTLCLNNINVVDKIKAEKEINEIFDKLYKNSISLFSSYQSTTSVASVKSEESSDSPKRIITEWAEVKSGTVTYEALPEFLRNNKEITIIVEPKKPRNEMDVIRKPSQECISLERRECEKSKRKQSMPRKIEKSILQEEIDVKNYTINLMNKLRDKHMINLITKKKHCYLCKNTNHKNAYYTKTSLLLHKLWRHKSYSRKNSCEKCHIIFDKTYQLILHQRLIH